MSHASILISMAVVDGLDTSAAWSVILGSSDFQLTIVRKRTDTLNQTLAIRPATHDGCPVQILECAGNDLGRRCRAGINQHNDRDFRVYRLCSGAEFLTWNIGIALG